MCRGCLPVAALCCLVAERFFELELSCLGEAAAGGCVWEPFGSSSGAHEHMLSKAGVMVTQGRVSWAASLTASPDPSASARLQVTWHQPHWWARAAAGLLLQGAEPAAHQASVKRRLRWVAPGQVLLCKPAVAAGHVGPYAPLLLMLLCARHRGARGCKHSMQAQQGPRKHCTCRCCAGRQVAVHGSALAAGGHPGECAVGREWLAATQGSGPDCSSSKHSCHPVPSHSRQLDPA